MGEAAVVNYSREKHSVELREIPRPQIGPDDVLLEVGLFLLDLVEQCLLELGLLTRLSDRGSVRVERFDECFLRLGDRFLVRFLSGRDGVVRLVLRVSG